MVKTWYTTVYKGFIISAILAYVIGFIAPTSKVTSGAYIAGHIMSILGIMMILVSLLTILLKDSTDTSATSNIIYKLFVYGGPFLLLLLNISFVLYLMVKHSDKINSGNVSDNYNAFSNITCALVVAQMYIVYSNVSAINDAQHILSKVMSSTLFLLGILFAMNSSIVYIILTYFVTDGFK